MTCYTIDHSGTGTGISKTTIPGKARLAMASDRSSVDYKKKLAQVFKGTLPMKRETQFDIAHVSRSIWSHETVKTD